ncbi:MAG: sigma-70 family RNA polymerase sigma factor [Bacteroidetes bacterium]|nr:sigma-70 family RNA polymerase sigma factor [Bacteroidota bacterium]
MKSTIQKTDSELIRLFKEGNINALNQLIERYKDKIYTSIYLLLKDKYLAEDMFQNTFIKVIETIRNGNYNEEGKFLPWVIRIAHNLCLDHFRKVKRSPSIKSADGEMMLDGLLDNSEGVESKMMKAQTHDKVRRLVDLLPNDQREVIVLRHYGGFSFKEVAAMTNCSINTALGRMRYGLINLRRMVDEKQIAL